MPERDFFVYFSDSLRMLIYFHSFRNQILNFIVKLEVNVSGQWSEIENMTASMDTFIRIC
jgi:hypothetical protein